jgi:EPTP domain
MFRMAPTLIERQRIATSGARAVQPFTVDGLELLAIPQLAIDIPGQRAGMNLGNSNTELMLLRCVDGLYEPWSTLPAPGGEDAEFFSIGDQAFLAVASIRSGSGPYNLAVDSQIYAWRSGRFEPFQSVRAFAAKQWRHWQIGDRHFLGLAQGLGNRSASSAQHESVVYEWDGSSFAEFQRIPSAWGYNWHPFNLDGVHFVAHAEHLGPSILYRWDGSKLVPHQTLAERSGRAFATFQREGVTYLVVVSIQDASWLMRWDGSAFIPIHELDGLGGRELAVIEHSGETYLVRVNFILGTPEQPLPEMESQVYKWVDGDLQIAAEFATTGATDAAVTASDGELRIIVSNSLSSEVRFAAETIVYAIEF